MKITLSICFFMLSELANAQGGWDLNYIPECQISDSLIGKQVLVDLGEPNSDQDVTSWSIRSLLASTDSIRVKTDHHDFLLVEEWEIYVDMGFFSEQSLVVINDKDVASGVSLLILKSVTDDHVVVIMRLPSDGEEEVSSSREIELLILRRNVSGLVMKM